MVKKVVNKISRLYKIYILKDEFLIAHRQWVKDNGDKTLRVNYDLNENSIVFDLGGYHGDFAFDIYNKYKSNIYIFEPVKQYYEIIRKRFNGNEKIKVYNFGLSSNDDTLEINISESASSIYAGSPYLNKEKIYLKSIIDFIDDNSIPNINLLKINIEGGEFDVLPSIIKSGYIENITDLQIQFHTFVDNSEEKRMNIRKDLSRTHTITYNYWFIWENWKRNDKK